MDAQQIRAAALARVQARRRQPEYRTVTVGGQDTRMQVDQASEFLGPADAGEWLDDRIARTPVGLGPWVPVLFAIAEGARDGSAAAVAAAQALGEWDQWHLYRTLQTWRSDALSPASGVFRAVLAEWGRLGLVMAEPADAPLPAGRVLNEADLSRPGVRRPPKYPVPACLDGRA